MRVLAQAASLAALLLGAARVEAQDSLGHKVLGTLGLEAGSQPQPGIYVADRLLWYSANQLVDRRGHRIPLAIDLDAIAEAVGLSATLRLPGIHIYLSLSAGVPLAKVRGRSDRPEASIDRFGLGDLYVQPLRLGWRGSRLEVVSGYAFYAPTGRFEPGGRGSGIGLGQWSHEYSLGGSYYFDRGRRWRVSALASYQLNHRKRGIDITRGETVQVQGGAGRRLMRIVEVGIVGYGLWQVSDDRGAALPPALVGARDRAVGLGAEVDVDVPAIGSRITARWARDIDIASRPLGQILLLGLTVAPWRPSRT